MENWDYVNIYHEELRTLDTIKIDVFNRLNALTNRGNLTDFYINRYERRANHPRCRLKIGLKKPYEKKDIYRIIRDIESNLNSRVKRRISELSEKGLILPHRDGSKVFYTDSGIIEV